MGRRLQIIILLFFTGVSFSQSKKELWSRLLINHDLSAKWGLSFDYNYRWQTDELGQNLFNQKLAEVYRLAISYRLNKTFTVSVAPYTLWKSSGLIIEEKDRFAEPILEKRWILNIEHSVELTKSMRLSTRLGNEYRIFPNSEIIRLRLRPQLNFTSSHNQIVRISTEYLANVFPNNLDFFSQARATFEYVQPIYKNFSLLSGYTYNFRAKTPINNELVEHIFLFTTILKI